jgi:hypothetical protein
VTGLEHVKPKRSKFSSNPRRYAEWG